MERVRLDGVRERTERYLGAPGSLLSIRESELMKEWRGNGRSYFPGVLASELDKLLYQLRAEGTVCDQKLCL